MTYIRYNNNFNMHITPLKNNTSSILNQVLIAQQWAVENIEPKNFYKYEIVLSKKEMKDLTTHLTLNQDNDIIYKDYAINKNDEEGLRVAEEIA